MADSIRTNLVMAQIHEGKEPSQFFSILQRLIILKPTWLPVSMREGNEPDIFWDALGGKAKYPKGKEIQGFIDDPHLFALKIMRGKACLIDGFISHTHLLEFQLKRLQGLVQSWAAIVIGILSGSIPWVTMMILHKKSTLLQKNGTERGTSLSKRGREKGTERVMEMEGGGDIFLDSDLVTDILQCCELYANIKRNTLPTPNPELVPHQPRYYPQFHYSHTSDATQDTFALTQPQQNLFELNTFSFTQLVSAPFPTNFLNTQAIDATEDQPHPYLSIPTIESTLSTLPTELEFTTEPDLTNNSIPLVRMKTKFYIINPKRKMMRKKFSLFDQSQPYHHTTYHHTCKIMKNPIFKILNTAIAWIAKKSNIRWRLSLKGCVAWTSYILASKQWEIRKLCEPHTCSNPSISQDHAKLSYLLISKSIHNLIENDPSTSMPTLIAFIKSIDRYTTTIAKHYWQSKRILKTSTAAGKDRTMIYQDCYKLCSNFFLVWSWKRKHCQCHHKEVKQ
ncbi:hypothetical protein JHK84_047921 [Glycine max]|nr:hypothetical protein JHK85_048509 [Glycine max]KAG5102952.1 hypothetical protein JHK84_047921 [Glycine max]